MTEASPDGSGRLDAVGATPLPRLRGREGEPATVANAGRLPPPSPSPASGGGRGAGVVNPGRISCSPGFLGHLDRFFSIGCRIAIAATILFGVWMASGAAFAVTPDERLADPALEARARAISQELRCLVCQNQSIDDSNAALAHDLRVLVRERLTAGDSDEQALDYIHRRYGDFVLLRPPVKPATYALWFGPAAILILGALAMVLFFRRRTQAASPAPLTDEERRRLDRLLEES